MTASDRIREARELAELNAGELERFARQLEQLARHMRNGTPRRAGTIAEAETFAIRANALGWPSVADALCRRTLEELATWEGRAFAVDQAAAMIRAGAELERRRADRDADPLHVLQAVNADAIAAGAEPITEQRPPDAIAARLEELRAELRAARMSWGELAELQGLAEHIDPGDVELLEAAGVPEFPDVDDDHSGSRRAEILEAEAPHLIAPAVDVASLTAGELEQLATDHPETAGAVVAELARRLEELEQLEAQLLPIGGIQRRTRSEPAAAALEIVLRVIRTNSPHRRRILRKIG